MTETTQDGADVVERLTPAQIAFLREAAENWLGVAKCRSTTGYARRAERAKAERLCKAGLMRKYVHGADEYEITDAGRAALKEIDNG
jgi:predicted transcriptional regulator